MIATTSPQGLVIKEPELSNMFVLVVNHDGGVLLDLEAEALAFTVYRNGEEILHTVLDDRAALCEWYKETVGFDPDDDEPDAPMLKLVENTAIHMMFQNMGEENE